MDINVWIDYIENPIIGKCSYFTFAQWCGVELDDRDEAIVWC